MIRLQQRWLLSVLVGVVACSAHSAYAQTDRIVRAALGAELHGFGGCDTIVVEPAQPIGYSRDLRFVRGSCTLEHGEASEAFVALDKQGQVFLLGTRAGFAFMIALHPSPALDSSAVLHYAAGAVRLQGAALNAPRLVMQASTLPDSLLDRMGVERSELWSSSRVLGRAGGGYEVALLLAGDGALANVTAMVYPADGMVEVMVHRRWAPEP